MVMARIPSQRRVDPIGRTPIVDSNGSSTDFFARQWKNLVDLVTSVIVLQDDSESNAARITVNEQKIATLEATEIGGDNIDIEPAPAALSAGNITLNLSDTAVTPGTYGDATNSPQITVDQKGRITGIVDVPISGGGGSAAWTLVSSQTIASGTANVDVNNLGGYSDILVVLADATASISQSRALRVSIDNGVSFLTASGDYQTISTAGAISNATFMGIGTATTGARSMFWLLTAADSADDPKLVQSSDSDSFFVRNASPIDAIRVQNGVSGTLNAGTLLVYGR
jgi:hypothetical protein